MAATLDGSDTVLIPNPYTGLTARLGKREINVHDVHEGIVYYGQYDDEADTAPYYCIGTYRLPEEDFINRLGRSILDGAVVFSLLDNRETLWPRP